jgi:amino acid transporter
VEAFRADGVPILPGNIPLFGKNSLAYWALLNLIFVAMGIAFALLNGARAIANRRRRNQGMEYSLETRGQYLAPEALLAAIGIAVFCLTEDMTATMVIADVWTAVSAAILAGIVIFHRLATRERKETLTQA